MADPLQYAIGLLIAILAIYFIMVDAFAALIPTATEITIIGINFSWVIQISVIVGLLYVFAKVVKSKSSFK